MNGLDLDPNEDLDDDDFRAKFGLKRVRSSRLHAKRERALKKNERIVKKQNVAYARGRKTWFERINGFSDLTDRERTMKKTGLKKPGRGRGLIQHDHVDERSERYFDQYRYSRGSVPASYDAVKEGHVTPARSQKQCGSCAAFATMAAVETCYKKVTGKFGDYSEQELLDCGLHGADGAYGCRGAWLQAYGTWIVDKKRKLMSERDYPYKGKCTGRCPREKPFRQGAQVSDTFYTSNGDENMLKKLVYEKGAVMIALNADCAFAHYAGGIFSRCGQNSKRSVNHAVVVVGYGSEGGQDFWLIKNSWGSWWGSNGYIKVKRGSNACGIGYWISTVDCKRA